MSAVGVAGLLAGLLATPVTAATTHRPTRPDAAPAARTAAPPIAVPIGSPATPTVPAGPGRGALETEATDGAVIPVAPLAALAVALGLFGAALVIAAGRRSGEPQPAVPDDTVDASAPPPPPDFERILADARSATPRQRDGRGSLVADRGTDTGEDGTTAVPAPVWVRRLDERIPIMPTIQTLPIDHDEEPLRPSRDPRRRGRR